MRKKRTNTNGYKRLGYLAGTITALLLVTVMVIMWSGMESKQVSSNQTASPVPTQTVITKEDKDKEKQTDSLSTEQQTKEPEEIKTVSLMAVGDDLIHTQIIKSGEKEDKTYNYDHLFEHITSYAKKADLAVINQETILGGKSFSYSGYPRFNSPTEIGDAIAKAGFNVVLHATNHSMDKGEKGLQNTINYWKEKKGITILGVNETKEEQDTIKIVEKNGIKIAMLNYTYSLNGLPLPKNRTYMVNLLTDSNQKKIEADLEKARKEADFVIVFPHWGTEYSYKISSLQKKWTEVFLEAGVDLVLGSHPHVLEPVEWVEREDGHKMLVYYSLGNYVSHQKEVPRMLGGMAQVTIEKKKDKTEIKEAQITPLVTHYNNKTNEHRVYLLEDYTEELANEHGLKSARNELSLSYFKKLAKDILKDWYK